jgi:hypothetical protein
LKPEKYRETKTETRNIIGKTREKLLKIPGTPMENPRKREKLGKTSYKKLRVLR